VYFALQETTLGIARAVFYRAMLTDSRSTL